MSRFRWSRYVPVAERREKTLCKMKKLKKQGMDIQPIEIENRKIANTFWGKAWCQHIESFSDYENRLPRGRTYVRNGSVCHLAIEKGKISAIVSGGSLYNINISIKPLPKNQWEAIKANCSGQIGSLLELLSGKLSDSVMKTVCHQQQGLFPKPNEISLSCDCPDWAIMCKHVAAVLYGVGARLDHAPDKLFLLRGVNHEELVDVSAAINDATRKGRAKRQRIDESALSDIFGIEVEVKNKSIIADVQEPSQLKKQNSLTEQQQQSSKSSFPAYLTGNILQKKRKSLGLTQVALASILGVSAARVSQWECKKQKRFYPKIITREKLQAIW